MGLFSSPTLLLRSILSSAVLAFTRVMATHSFSGRHHYGENGNTLSINTERVRPQDVLAVRGSPSPDRQFDPMAPVFVNNQGSAHNCSAPPGINMPTPGYNPAQYTQNTGDSYTTTSGMNVLSQGYSPMKPNPNGVDNQYIRAAQDQNMAVYGHDYRVYGPNLPYLPSAMHTPPPNQLAGPTQGHSSPVFPRPRPRAIQHSPPHRAYHEPMTASHGNEYAEARMLQSRTASLRSRRLEKLQELKKVNLSSFQEATKRRVVLHHHIESLRQGGNDRLPELYQSEFELQDTGRARETHGRMYKQLEEEIDELQADLTVPHEARKEEECQAFAGE